MKVAAGVGQGPLLTEYPPLGLWTNQNAPYISLLFCKNYCSAPTTLPASESNIPGKLEVGRVLREFESCVKIATLCARRVVTSSFPRSTR